MYGDDEVEGREGRSGDEGEGHSCEDDSKMERNNRSKSDGAVADLTDPGLKRDGDVLADAMVGRSMSALRACTSYGRWKMASFDGRGIQDGTGDDYQTQ